MTVLSIVTTAVAVVVVQLRAILSGNQKLALRLINSGAGNKYSCVILFCTVSRAFSMHKFIYMIVLKLTMFIVKLVLLY